MIARRRIPWLLVALLATSGCVYKVDIQQGNFIDDKAVAQVEAGMTRSQVRFLLGTPMIADSFDQDRWDYVYFVKIGKTGDLTERHVLVWFDADKVVKVDKPDHAPQVRSARPESAPPAPESTPPAAEPAPPTPESKPPAPESPPAT
jgi:outer membrane protein assembly factor BamE